MKTKEEIIKDIIDKTAWLGPKLLAKEAWDAACDMCAESAEVYEDELLSVSVDADSILKNKFKRDE